MERAYSLLETIASPKVAELVFVAHNKTVRVEYFIGYRPGRIFVIIDYRGDERLIRWNRNRNRWEEYGSLN